MSTGGGLLRGTDDFKAVLAAFKNGTYSQFNYSAEAILKANGWEGKYDSTAFADSVRNLVANLFLTPPEFPERVVPDQHRPDRKDPAPGMMNPNARVPPPSAAAQHPAGEHMVSGQRLLVTPKHVVAWVDTTRNQNHRLTLYVMMPPGYAKEHYKIRVSNGGHQVHIDYEWPEEMLDPQILMKRHGLYDEGHNKIVAFKEHVKQLRSFNSSNKVKSLCVIQLPFQVEEQFCVQGVPRPTYTTTTPAGHKVLCVELMGIRSNYGKQEVETDYEDDSSPTNSGHQGGSNMFGSFSSDSSNNSRTGNSTGNRNNFGSGDSGHQHRFDQNSMNTEDEETLRHERSQEQQRRRNAELQREEHARRAAERDEQQRRKAQFLQDKEERRRRREEEEAAGLEKIRVLQEERRQIQQRAAEDRRRQEEEAKQQEEERCCKQQQEEERHRQEAELQQQQQGLPFHQELAASLRMGRNVHFQPQDNSAIHEETEEEKQQRKLEIQQRREAARLKREEEEKQRKKTPVSSQTLGSLAAEAAKKKLNARRAKAAAEEEARQKEIEDRERAACEELALQQASELEQQQRRATAQEQARQQAITEQQARQQVMVEEQERQQRAAARQQEEQEQQQCAAEEQASATQQTNGDQSGDEQQNSGTGIPAIVEDYSESEEEKKSDEVKDESEETKDEASSQAEEKRQAFRVRGTVEEEEARRKEKFKAVCQVDGVKQRERRSNDNSGRQRTKRNLKIEQKRGRSGQQQTFEEY